MSNIDREEAYENFIKEADRGDRVWLMGALQQNMHMDGQDIPLHKSTWKKLCKDCQQRIRGKEEPEDAVSVILPRPQWEEVMKQIENGELKKFIEHQLMDVISRNED